MAVSAGRHQAGGNPGAGDVPRTDGRNRAASGTCKDSWTYQGVVALRCAFPLGEARVARLIPRAETDMVFAAHGGAGLRRVAAGHATSRIRCLALERLLGAA